MSGDIGTAIVVLVISGWFSVLAYRMTPGRFMAPEDRVHASTLAT